MANGKIQIPKTAIEIPETAVEAPEASFETPPVRQPQPQSLGETAAHSAAQGASFGLEDEYMGLLGAIAEKLGIRPHVGERQNYGPAPWLKPGDANYSTSGNLEDVGPQMDRQAGISPTQRAYMDDRDTERATVKQGQQDNPKTAAAAEIAGSLLAPGPKMKPATGLARVAEGAKAGAKVGALYGFGKSEGDLPDTAISTALGAGQGGVVGGALGGVSALLRNYLRSTAESQAARAMGAEGGISDKMRKMGVGDEEARHELARTALDQGLVSGLPSKATIAGRARNLIDQATNLKNATLTEADVANSRLPFDPDYAAAKARGTLTNLDPRQARNLGPAVKSIEDILALKNGLTDDSVVAADKLKSSLQSTLAKQNAYSDLGDPAIGVKLDKRVAAALRQAIEEHTDDALGPGAGEKLRLNNKLIQQGLNIEELAKNAASRAAQRNTVGLGDKMMLGAGLASGASPLEAVAKAGGYGITHNLLNRFGNGVNAQALDALGNGAAVVPATQSLTSDEEKRRTLVEKLQSLMGN